ncbi:MAG: thiaminase II [Acidibacillus sp.]|uniref:Aminopyrimidine aminohydrolase n=1 Tax=Sulfoacidibacillus ferrooxidans TaxID=2005001 RepID=A0A9X1VA12_9BACL|nr:thiaminase II [Sulfoacidibacillus ferrooxidans]MCI0182908.1 Aminopyrimidine aminohydrolase [Sulfoacidibacillus ferrooxidans]MCY0893519.1 thiaminase II [Acidibacillus sp.]
MTFTDQLRQAADDLWKKSLTHPFVIEIADGSLPTQKFSHYVQNDSYYLSVFARVQSRAASKARDMHTIARLAVHAQSTVEAEHLLHKTFFNLLDITPSPSFIPAPAAYEYTTHLLSISADGTLGEIIAAILPCYWLYWEIGEKYRYSQPNHPIYDQWIATYGDEWYGKLVDEQIYLLDQLAEQASEEQQHRMKQHFMRSSYYELRFWDMAYHLEGWPQGM